VRKALLFVALLVVGAAPLIGQFPYHYTNTVTTTYSGNTIDWIEHIQGSASMSGSTYHTPQDAFYFTNGEQGSSIDGWTNQGRPVLANGTQMNYSNVWSIGVTPGSVTTSEGLSVPVVQGMFINSPDCNIDTLFAGDCFGETQPQIWCPIMGSWFWKVWKKIQFEDAFTFTIATGDAGGGYLTQSTDCNNAPSQPIDWPGEAVIVDPNGGINSGYIQSALLYRTASWGSKFSGPWSVLYIDPWTRRNTNTPGPCTSHDGNPPITGHP